MTKDDAGVMVTPKTLGLMVAIFLGSTVGGGGASALLSPGTEIREQTEKLTRIDVKLDMALEGFRDHEVRMRAVEDKIGACESRLASLERRVRKR